MFRYGFQNGKTGMSWLGLGCLWDCRTCCEFPMSHRDMTVPLIAESPKHLFKVKNCIFFSADHSSLGSNAGRRCKSGPCLTLRGRCLGYATTTSVTDSQTTESVHRVLASNQRCIGLMREQLRGEVLAGSLLRNLVETGTGTGARAGVERRS